MPLAAIVGAGPIGTAIAHRLANRASVRHVLLVDDELNVAVGKALDIQQSGPIDRVDVGLSATSDLLGASGADVIVVADAVNGGEWRSEAGLALVQRLVR